MVFLMLSLEIYDLRKICFFANLCSFRWVRGAKVPARSNGFAVARSINMESLILAQSERWRRA